MLSMDNTEAFYVYDSMLFEPLAKLGWQAEEISWRQTSVDWNDFDVVIVRSTWDYQDAAEEFMNCLQTIDASNATLENSLATMQWNIDKSYLKDIQQQGVKIVPTWWFEHFDVERIRQGFTHFDSQECILKPLVSANADHTYRLTITDFELQLDDLEALFAERPFMMQPFIDAIVDEGEYSLFYFASGYSHCILKMPKQNDFRVQEEHGGQLALVEPEPALKALAERTLKTLPDEPLYARLDFIRCKDGFAVMEVELIEPSLYFNMDEHAAQRFADAFVARYGNGQ